MNSFEKTRTWEHALRLLSAFFYEPEKKTLVEENVLDNLRHALDEICPQAVPHADKMKESFEKYSEEELRVEYARLFAGPFELLAPPYGSVYLDEGRRVMGDSTMQVAETYREEGLSRSDDCHDLPDHISVELEFISYLLFKGAQAIEKSEDRAANRFGKKLEIFVKKQLRPWVGQFCNDIKKGTENAFFTALADCLFEVVSCDEFVGFSSGDPPSGTDLRE